MPTTTGVAVVSVVAEVDAHEGPTYLPADDALYVTTVPRRSAGASPRAQVKRIALAGGLVTTVNTGTVMPNGMTRDLHGNLLICEQGDRDHEAAIVRFDPRTGTTSTVL
jgi:gluconolactonase